ncbi:MAG: hypothetical protein BZY80_04540 [SAR202 cluster bacterium Io17-Chloro-G2]|nr:MAG: hypothetical protein BZY80_04540 [SAR202 cluster bacterium Io17-Chloro-G2]
MARVHLDLEAKESLRILSADGWRRGMGLVPGEPNQGLVAEMLGSPARLAEYDDSSWEQDVNVQERLSVGFTFAWYRLAFTMPEEVNGQKVAGNRVYFETNVDNYGEIYIDGKIDGSIGVVTGNNTQKRAMIEEPAVPGAKHVIALLVANAPLGTPVGAIFVRYVTMAFEQAPAQAAAA